jgi:exopolysaccharide biosynthesis polyprenyl glycosylphosphotransferase
VISTLPLRTRHARSIEAVLHKKQAINLQLNQVADAILLVIALYLCHAFRYWGTIYFDFPTRIPPFREFNWLLIVIVPLAPLLLEMQGYYKLSLTKSMMDTAAQIVRAGLWLFVAIGACVIFFRLHVPSRSVLLLFAPVAVIVLLLKERLLVHQLRRRAAQSDIRERVLLAGTPEDIQRLESSFTEDVLTEIVVVDRIDVEKQSIKDLVEALHRHAVGRVIFAGGQSHLGRIQEGIAACEDEGVEAMLAVDFFRTSIAKPGFTMLGGRPMLVFRSAPEFSWQIMLKEFIDRLGAFVGLIVLSPLFLFAAIMVRLSSPGPILFCQMRGGRHGRPFKMYKFRTMFTDAEMRRAELQAFNQMSGPVFKVDNDPRVTSFGRWLRKTSIDEFPQLFNVLRGEMSLVGPRPLPLYEVEQFADTRQRRRLSVKPGLTCLWQISGRNNVTNFEDWVRLDLEYIDNWSLWLDLKILFKTIPVVLLGLGAK